MARRLSALCTGLAPVLLLLGILAGFVNHQVLDGPRFADHIDAMRQDPAVARQLGLAMTQGVINVDPDLIAVRPLVEAATTSLAASSVFSSVVTATARQVHEYFTNDNSGQVALRLADIGSILGGVLPSISPEAADNIPPGLDVTLGELGSQSFAAGTIRLTHLVGLLAWLLPLLALLLFAAGVFLAADRLRAAFWAGWGVAGAGAAIGLLWVAGSFVASEQDTGSLRGALVAAGWAQVGGSLWWLALLTAGAGAFLAAAASAHVPDLDIGAVTTRAWGWCSQRPERAWVRGLRAGVLVLIGLGCVLQPGTMARLLVLVLGWLFLLTGVGELATLAGARRHIGSEGSAVRRPWAPVLGLGLAGALVIGVVAYQALPADSTIRTVAASSGTACNGHVALCDRPYNDVAFPAAHNAMSAADQPGWYLPEQPTGFVGALDDGIRALLIDTWYGQPTNQPGRVLTAPRSFEAALQEARSAYGDEVVASAQRLRASFAKPTGPAVPYMCHGLCETGGTVLEPALAQVRSWLASHPREVVTFVIEDNVTPADTVTAFRAAGLLPYVHTQRPGHLWPTLGQLIDSGHRLVVMMERHGGGSAAPWLLSAFDWVQDTSYTNPTVADLSCALNRGSADDPLFMINNWLSSFSSLITDARKVNAFGQLWPYVERCRQERGQIPNFVAVNWYDQGDVFQVVDGLNGVH